MHTSRGRSKLKRRGSVRSRGAETGNERAASLLVARATVACSTVRQPRCSQHEPLLLAAQCGSLVACSTSHRCLQHDARCGSPVACSTSHRCLQHDAAASLLAARATAARSAVRGGHRRGQMDGAATPLGERDPLGLPLTPSEGRTLPEGAQVQCPRGVLALRGKRHF